MYGNKLKNAASAAWTGAQIAFALLAGSGILLFRRARNAFLDENATRTICVFWSDILGYRVEDAVELLSAGDEIRFRYKGHEYRVPNTDAAWYSRRAKGDVFAENPPYSFTALLPDGTCIEGTCSGYGPDPDCVDSPGLVIDDGTVRYHVAERNVSFKPI